MTTLYTAAGEVSRLVPKEHLTEQFLFVLDAEKQVVADDGPAGEGQTVIWF